LGVVGKQVTPYERGNRLFPHLGGGKWPGRDGQNDGSLKLLGVGGKLQMEFQIPGLPVFLNGVGHHGRAEARSRGVCSGRGYQTVDQPKDWEERA
jgi:hypothetical protein